MQAVGRLGSYISRGVYTVSSPFHPFGGAVDIVLVEQQDGSFKSSPWYVRFGKFQGVLKAKEKVVSINVNGVDANFHMHLDHTGEAFFLREVDAEDEESMLYPPSSGYETDFQIKKRLKYKTLSFDSEKSISMAEVDINNGSILTRSSSDTGDNDFQREVRNTGLNRARSLEHANVADNLLEVKWSTNIASHKPPKKDRVKVQKSKSQRNNMENSLNKPKLNEQACSHNKQEGAFSNSDLEVSRGYSEDEGIYSSCLSTQFHVRYSKEKTKVITEVSTSIDITKDTELDRKAKEDLSDGNRCDSEVACLQLEGRIEKQLNGDVSGVSIMRDYGISEEKISANGVQSPAYSESESSMGSMYCTRERTDQALNFVNKRCEEVNTPAEVLQMTTVTRNEESTKNADVGMPVMEVSQTSQQKNCSFHGVSKFNVADSEDQTIFPKPQVVNLDLGLCSAEKVEPNYAATTFSNCSQGNQALEEKTLKAEDVSSTLTSSLESSGDCIFRKTSRPPSIYSEEEHFLFSDLDESKGNEDEDSDSSEYVDKEDKFSDSFHLSSDNSATEDQTADLGKLRVTSSPTVIPNNKDAGEKDWQQTKSSPHSMHSHSNALDQQDLHYPLGHSLDSKSQILKQPLPEEPGAKDNLTSGESESAALNRPSGANAPSTPQGGNWRLWPFSFRRSTSEKVLQHLDANDTKASESPIDRDADQNELKPKPLKKNVRATTPTSEQLASLNLKEGKNSVTFTFSTNMLGNQQVDAQMYLWKWNTHIVISDVDGTITKSDVLGQFMPLVGVDWSQTGVTHLFSAIKENGYELLFLSARSISQAYQTRQFLVNLKQDGKVLPDGPVVISPDGLFPSLFREVVRRAPHEFKIACLEDIKALFPSDFNPFYAGFGNRDTDELSYLKVGIPRGKIFIINPRGEVAVNRRHHKKSYASLHALVNGIFPPPNKTEQEDYNSWNYWKLPPPDIY